MLKNTQRFIDVGYITILDEYSSKKGEDVMTSEYIIIMCTILVYLAGMLMIGFYCAKQNDSTSAFFLGGRKMGPYITAMSA